MNFLAHAILAGATPAVVAGSTAGDFIKGVLHDDQYPAEFLHGIRLHRRLDAFSNTQEHLRASANRLPKTLRRLAPPCIDMIADHFLARAALWHPGDYLPAIGKTVAPITLLGHEDWVHSTLSAHWHRLSPDAQRFFTHARTTLLFSNYADFERTSRGIGYVCERLGRAADAPAMIHAISENLGELETDFYAYWPALVAEAERFQDTKAQGPLP